MHLKRLCFALLAVAACGDDKKTVGFVADTLDFGQTDCGTAAQPHTLVLYNPTADAYTFTTAFGAGASSIYTVTPDSGAVLAGTELELTITSRAIPQTSATSDNLYGDTLTITTTSHGDQPHTVAIKQTAHGAILSVSAPTVDFATPAKVGAPATTNAITISNQGNAPADVTVASDGFSFVFTSGGAQTIAPGASLAGQVSYSPKAIGAIHETLAVQATGPTCGAPVTFAATGTGSISGMAVRAVPGVTRARGRNSNANTLCVQLTGGYVACTGADIYGLRGGGDGAFDYAGFNLVRTPDGALDGVTELEAGRGFYCGVRQQGDIWCWGDIFGLGHKGIADPRSRNSIARQVVATGGKSVSGAYAYTCTVTDPGGVLTCSGTPFGGNQTTTANWNVVGATQVAMHGGGGAALLADGSVMSFGTNAAGERGNNDNETKPPSLVLTNPSDPASVFTGVTQLAASGGVPSRRNHHVCALESDGTVWCWGHNRHGQLGDGSTSDRVSPVQVMIDPSTPLTGVTSITAAENFSCAVASGIAYCWGRGDSGQLGNGNTGSANAFAAPIGGSVTTFATVAARGAGACGATTTGELLCWGNMIGGGAVPAPVAAFEP